MRIRSGDRFIELGPGDIIGRLPTAAWRLNDPRVSEVHCFVSLRQAALRLLALRGRFEVDGVPLIDVELRPGLSVSIADTTFTVVSVCLPGAALGLALGPGQEVVLPPVASLRAGRLGVELHAGFQPGCDAVLWFDGETCQMRRPHQPDCEVHEGDVLAIGSHEVRVVSIARHGVEPTERDPHERPLRLTLRHDTVHIRHAERDLTIDGVPARILCELGLLGQPVEWRIVAREVWPGEDDDQTLRRRWDRGLARLRATLGELSLRDNLVRLTGAGRVELYLHPHDKVEDQT